jgi:folylpolyglutamate synthase
MPRKATSKVFRLKIKSVITQKLNLSIDFLNHMYDPNAIAGMMMQKQFAAKWKSLDPEVSVAVVSSIEEALDYAEALAKGDGKGVEEEVQVLVTGSLHLVGGALAVLEGAAVL